MSLADRFSRSAPRQSAAAPPAPAATPASNGAGPPEQAAASEELRRRRDALSRSFADLQWDLGGIAYEMASRDHFRLDVLTRQAAKLQEVDAELAGTERMLRLEEAGAAGTCHSCGALYARGAAFCWSCGSTLIESAGPATQPADPAPQREPGA